MYERRDPTMGRRCREVSVRLPERRFEAVIADWDGTVVPDRTADASVVRELIERLCGLGADVAIVTGTELRNVDGQLGARPSGPGHLYLCLNRGSEVFRVDVGGVHTLERRHATSQEEAALEAAAELTVRRLRQRGLDCRVVSSRLNRRKIDLVPVPEWEDPPKARIGQLLAAVEERLRRSGMRGIADVVDVAIAASADAGLADPRVTSDAKHVEIGLTDKSDSMSWLLDDLWRRGVGPAEVLIAGDEFGPLGGLPGSDSLMLTPGTERSTVVSVGVEPTGVPEGIVRVDGGPDAFAAILEDQIRRRLARELPPPDDDPEWVMTLEGVDPERERVHEALLTLADGRIGTNGSPLGVHRTTAPEVLHIGVYDGEGSEEHLLPGPIWTGAANDLEADPPPKVRRLLDMRTGMLTHEVGVGGQASRALAFSSFARPGVVGLRAEGPPRGIDVERPLAAPAGRIVRAGNADGAGWLSVAGTDGGVVAAVHEDLRRSDAATAGLERRACYHGTTYGDPDPDPTLRALRRLEPEPFDALLREHRETWARRWEDADVVIQGDPELQKAVRFCLYHLMTSVPDTDEAAVGARGLSGQGYRGHVFWDADVFTLPFLAATHAPAARAMLEYRVRRLGPARTAAAAEGRSGARFPWESARSGAEVTPTTARDQTGALREIRTGELEVHVVADVAWAAAWYLAWTNDEAFAVGGGRELLVETARYWASRIRVDADGRGHIDGVIGPDEYHEDIDDNAFTNVMARWNLRRAAAAARDRSSDVLAVDPDEIAAWLLLADSVVDGYDATTGLYEQFAGFYELEPLIISLAIPRRPIPADLVLGVERVGAAQVVKQADVLMLHHMVPEEMIEGSLEPNLAYYEPRTAHGSSLSPGIHAALLARAGRTQEAVEALRLAARIDLDDLTGTTASGLHLAAMGSVWQALAMGFGGLYPRGDALVVDPVLPASWGALELRVRFRGSGVRIRVEPGSVRVTSDAVTHVVLGGRRIAVDPGHGAEGRRLRDGTWEVTDA
jgi:trehalose/maltose hydrolase-like predicted phosphorylase